MNDKTNEQEDIKKPTNIGETESKQPTDAASYENYKEYEQYYTVKNDTVSDDSLANNESDNQVAADDTDSTSNEDKPSYSYASYNSHGERNDEVTDTNVVIDNENKANNEEADGTGDEPKKSKKKWYKNPIIITILAVIALMGIITGTVMYLYSKIYIKNNVTEYEPTRTKAPVTSAAVSATKMKDKNIVVFGVDKDESRTDTIMVVHIDGETSKATVVSIPRDTKVYWSDEQIEAAKKLNISYMQYSKITDMSSLGGIENLRQFTIRSIEEMLDIKVDNYVVINTKVIRDVVDNLGGIEVNVPRRMKYDDNYQDLHIDLEPGLQVLNGKDAEGFVRWRHNNDYSEQYAMGDLGRIETQQAFIKALADKVLNDMTLDKVLGVCQAVYVNLKTDVSLTRALEYLTSYYNVLKLDNISFATLPGEPQREDLWYFIIDQNEINDFIDVTFYNGKASTNKDHSKDPEEGGKIVASTPKPKVDYSDDEDDDYNSELIEQIQNDNDDEEEEPVYHEPSNEVDNSDSNDTPVNDEPQVTESEKPSQDDNTISEPVQEEQPAVSEEPAPEQPSEPQPVEPAEPAPSEEAPVVNPDAFSGFSTTDLAS